MALLLCKIIPGSTQDRHLIFAFLLTRHADFKLRPQSPGVVISFPGLLESKAESWDVCPSCCYQMHPENYVFLYVLFLVNIVMTK